MIVLIYVLSILYITYFMHKFLKIWTNLIELNKELINVLDIKLY